MRLYSFLGALPLVLAIAVAAQAADPPAPVITNITVKNKTRVVPVPDPKPQPTDRELTLSDLQETRRDVARDLGSSIVVPAGNQVNLQWTPYPATELYRVLKAPVVDGTYSPAGGRVSGFSWQGTETANTQFYQVDAVPMSSDALWTANLLNRIAYGPTPDELERVLTGPAPIGPQAYLDEQLAPETITDNLNDWPISEDVNGNTWIYVQETATLPSSATYIYIYLSVVGEAYIDDLTLVQEGDAGPGPNLIQDGDFDTTFPTDAWRVGTNMTGSAISTGIKHSGQGSLHVVADARGNGLTSSISQRFTPVLQSGGTYTLSYWYLPSTNEVLLTIRLNNNGIVSVPDRSIPGLFPRLNGVLGDLADLRAWFCMRAVGSKRQLFEVLTQFLENHFVTQHEKTRQYLRRYYENARAVRLAAELEFREISRWRDSLLRPDCTFYDLLRISAESPAMIVYLDTVSSRGDGRRIANENYSRELFELLCNGVDNGYNQQDIVEGSKAWTGWRLEIVDAGNINDPFAPRSTTLIDPTGDSAISNLVGVWTFNYQANFHNNSNKTLFAGQTVDTRFGKPWAGKKYELNLPARSGPDGINDGYDIIRHLGDSPYTMEFISVKLCRLLVHDNFVHGVYDYTDRSRSPEADLVHRCMMAWENSSPKGQLRQVLRTILESDLFRGHAASMQKVKTPLEHVASAIRSFRLDDGSGTVTGGTDGFSFALPLNRMGGMFLFDRAEPDGYPEAGPGWISAGTLAERIRFAQSLCIAPGQSGHTGSQNGVGNDAAGSWLDPVKVIKQKLPPADWNNAGAVADYFLSLLFPGEGRANLSFYRESAVEFLNTDDNGTASAFSGVSNASAYDVRVRGVAALLMSLPRFQEQ